MERERESNKKDVVILVRQRYKFLGFIALGIWQNFEISKGIEIYL